MRLFSIVLKFCDRKKSKFALPQKWNYLAGTYAAQVIIKKKFPEISGLMCVSFSPAADYPKQAKNKLIQMLHSPSHWVVVAAKGFLGPNNSYCLGQREFHRR